MKLAPVEKSTTAHKAADQIIKLILQGVWKPGDQLPSEREMVEQLSVGRSTVREALQILSTLNVVQIVPGQGSFIKNVGADDLFRPDLISLLINDAAVLDLIEAREMIEPQTIRYTCLRISNDQIAAIDVQCPFQRGQLGFVVTGAAMRRCKVTKQRPRMGIRRDRNLERLRRGLEIALAQSVHALTVGGCGFLDRL